MNNNIAGYIGRLGTGKSLSAVIDSYSDFCNTKTEIASTVPLTIKHTPVRDIEDIVNLENCTWFNDEGWALADNRKRNVNSEISTLVCLRSRKRRLDIRYTMQFLQIDIRIAYLTNVWIKPKCYPFNPNPLFKVDIIPEIIIQEMWDCELNPLPNRVIANVKDYFCLYDTTKDPYFVKGMIDETLAKNIKKKLKDSLTDDELKRYDEIRNGIRTKNKRYGKLSDS